MPETTTVTLARPMCSIQKACTLAAVSRRTLYHWMDTGKVEFIRTAGGQRRVFVDSLFRGPNGERMVQS